MPADTVAQNAHVKPADTLGDANAVIVFADDAATVRDFATRHSDELPGLALLWVAYRNGHRADVNRDTVWPILAEHGLRPIGQVAVDEEWSALRFRPNRAGEAAFAGGTNGR